MTPTLIWESDNGEERWKLLSTDGRITWDGPVSENGDGIFLKIKNGIIFLCSPEREIDFPVNFEVVLGKGFGKLQGKKIKILGEDVGDKKLYPQNIEV